MGRTGSGSPTVRRVILAVVSIAIIAVCVFFTVRRFGRRAIPVEPLTLCCAECGEVAWDQPAHELPAECPKCKKKALRIAMQCYECKHVFVQPPLSQLRPKDPMAPSPVITCPKCGATFVGKPTRSGTPPKPRGK